MFRKLILVALLLTSAAYTADSGAVNESKQVFAGKKIFLDYSTPVATTLSADTSLVAESARVQQFDANGSTRVVTLPAVGPNTGLEFFIVNTSTTAVNLTVKNASAATIGTVHQSESGIFWCDGATWTGFVYTTAASGFLTADGNTTGATSAAQILTNGLKLDAITGNTATPLVIAAKVGATNTIGNATSLVGGAGNGTGAGAVITLTGGAGGATNAAGGNSSVVGGASTGTGAGGAGRVLGGAVDGIGNAAGGAIVLTSANGFGSGAGGANTQVSGNGGATGAGGAFAVTAGAGGTTSGAAGTLALAGGVGGVGSTTTGGIASLIGGGSGTGATGNGAVSKIVGGAALSTNGSGGAAQATGGVATGTGTGGAVSLLGGASAGAGGTAGAVTIDSGAATGGTAATITIGTTNALGVTLGADGIFLKQAGGRGRCTTTINYNSNTTLATPTGMTAVTLVAGRTYRIRGHLYTISTANCGLKLALTAATLTATSFIGNTHYWNNGTSGTGSQVTSLGALQGVTAEIVTDVDITGLLVVNAGGTLALQAAQNASHADTTSVKAGSWIEYEEIP